MSAGVHAAAKGVVLRPVLSVATIATQATPPSPQEAALTMAETGQNAVPYLGNQYLQAYQAIINAMEQPIK